MLDDFMTRAFLAGLGLALVSAPLGCFVVWRRMAYFGDATAHAAMLGVALSLATQTDVFFGALIFAIGLEWTVGVVLYFLGLPKAMQPVHLVLSIGILASISYPLFLSFRKP